MHSRDHSILNRPCNFSRFHRCGVTAGGDGEASPRLAKVDRGLSPLDLLHERAATLAIRASNGSLPFLDAVDLAYSAAEFAGLIESYGDDVIQLVLADAFGGRQ